MKKFISIYKSPKKEGMYIYLNKASSIDEIPKALLELFGAPVLVTHMIVEEDKKFSKFEAKELLASVKEKGFYLQMPDPLPEYRKFLVSQNDKLDASSNHR